MKNEGLPAESLGARVARNFFTHSGHVPLVILILEFLVASPGYFSSLDPYLLLGVGIFQSALSEWMKSRGRPLPLLSNLAGPLLYSLIEAGMEGGEFFLQWHHLAYWSFALGFAVLQTLQAARADVVAPLVLAENLLRSAIPLVFYALFESRVDGTPPSIDVFLADRAHVFLGIVLLLLGLLLGFADIGMRRSMARIRNLTQRLREYSEWSLGRSILDRAIDDERALSLRRVERAVVFVDIRGFTAWSEQQDPEEVVGMLNEYYRTMERALADVRPIKLKYTADEVMAVFSDAGIAAAAAQYMLDAARPWLAPIGLSVGAGVHYGPVVEGVLGGSDARAYDFIGDTVNTAQRLCDAALPGEVLASIAVCEAAGIVARRCREVKAKGKREPLQAAVLDETERVFSAPLSEKSLIG